VMNCASRNAPGKNEPKYAIGQATAEQPPG